MRYHCMFVVLICAVAMLPSAADVSIRFADYGTAAPPDATGAVGSYHIVTALTDRFVVHNRSGILLKSMSLNDFWAPLGIISACNPRIVYDTYESRWFFIASTGNDACGAAILLAVSQTHDPAGSWNLYRIPVDSDSAVWADAPTLGFSRLWIVVQANMLNIPDDSFNCSNIYAFNKARLIAGEGASFALFSSSVIGASQVPAQTYDSCMETHYLLQDWRGDAGNRGILRLYAITGPVDAPTLQTVAFPSCPEPWASLPPVINKGFAPQKDTPLRIMNGDSRIQNVVYRNGSLWTAQTIFVPADAPTHSAIQWWQIDTDGTPQQRGRIEDPGATSKSGFFYGFPSIAVNSASDVLIGFSRFSAGSFASAGYAYRLVEDLHNSLSEPIVMQRGFAQYTKDFGSGRIPWGGYSASVVDPVNDLDFWTLQEYAETPISTMSRWGVTWGVVRH